MRLAPVLVVLLCSLASWFASAPPALADDGPWGWPLAGEVSRPFAPPASRYGAGHRGVDLTATPGTAVRAAGDGRVTYAGLLAGRGVVVVTHGTLRTTYEPVHPLVALGSQVALGDVLGRLEAGHAGCPASACLHWGLRRGEDYLDPVRLVERGPVRLLPLEAGAGRLLAQSRAGRGEATRGAPPRVRTGAPPARALARVAGEPVVTLAPAPAEQPSLTDWSLRAADAPAGIAAAAALILGVGLLARRRSEPRPHPDPEEPPSASGGGAQLEQSDENEPPSAQVLELDVERLRRRTA